MDNNKANLETPYKEKFTSNKRYNSVSLDTLHKSNNNNNSKNI